MSFFSSLYFVFLSAVITSQAETHSDIATPDWNALNRQIGGLMIQGTPFAQPCFSQGFDSQACTTIQEGYLDELTRTQQPGAYIQTQWETCQTTGQQCLLNYLNASDLFPTFPPSKCQLGSVPSYFINVTTAGDVATAFSFSKKYGVPLTIKNTGHDYKGRSSAPGSLALWTHNLKNATYVPSFVPEGCSKASPAVTFGAGVQWGEAYAFAELNNITLVGGSDGAVGAVGGWLQGGGHSALSNTMGMGVDRVLQYKVVTPDGQLRIVNACQNQDLFFALRGGGGGTFGVVLEASILASPQATLQAIVVSFPPTNVTLKQQAWSIMADNGIKWASEGWGGFSTAGVVILINPKISKDNATASIAPLITFANELQAANITGAELVATEFPSYGAFFKIFSSQFIASVGSSLAIASRLISETNFATVQSRKALVNGLIAADAAAPGLIILLTTPYSFPGDGSTSVTEAWRTSVYHVTVVSKWNWNATTAEKKSNYTTASSAIDNLRKITPDAAYLNEADVHEPNHEGKQ